jgi:hypothetical protein
MFVHHEHPHDNNNNNNNNTLLLSKALQLLYLRSLMLNKALMLEVDSTFFGSCISVLRKQAPSSAFVQVQAH